MAERSFRFLKVPAKLLLNKAATAQSDIHPEDLADLLAGCGIDLIAEHIENESTVLDLLDITDDTTCASAKSSCLRPRVPVFGQGFLFSQPRPVRAQALQGNEVAGPAA